MTEYIILMLVNDGDDGDSETWQTKGRTKASSTRRALATSGFREGTYVAVPARSWKPLKVSVEQTTKITIG